jgi:Leucine-rich repeat (LRR) protein
MRNINYDNNPIKNPREDVLAQGSESVILYLQRMYQSALSNGLEMINANLKHFPVEALTVPKLHSLTLDDNLIEVLPAEMFVLSGLTMLSLQRNRLKEIPPECGLLTSLVRLLLNDNHLTEIPLSFGLAKSLQEVDLQNNGEWQTPPPEVVRQGSGMVVNYLKKFGEAYETQSLVLEAMRLEAFPRDCYRFMEHFGPLNPVPLRSISVCHNKVATLPDDINQLSMLEELLLDENEFESFPEALGELYCLRKLSFCKNYFNSFPVQVSACSRLQSLRFSENAMVRIHPGVGKLTLLTELQVDFDKIVEPSIDVLTQGCAATVRYLGQINQALTTFHLNLPNFKLVSFPPELVNTPTHPVPQAGRLLTVLLPGNKMETIPTTMSALTLMTKLDLSDNKLTRISVVMGAWARLEYLDMSGNSISELPSTLGNLRRLQVLRLSDNKLTALPPYMAKLTHLHELFLGGNQLQVSSSVKLSLIFRENVHSVYSTHPAGALRRY